MARLTKAGAAAQQGQRAELEARVLDMLLQGQGPGVIETALGLAAGEVSTMRRGRGFQAALRERRAGRDLARMDRLHTLAGRALETLESVLAQDDVDPKLALAILQAAAKLPPAVYPGDGDGTMTDMERNAAQDTLYL